MRRDVLTLFVLLLIAAPVQAQITIPHTFVSGTVADPDEVNTNFSTVGTQALNRTGGTLTGTLTVNNGVTIDGVDISAVLGGTGTPTFATVTTTGSLSIGAGLTVANGITAGSGAVPIVNSTGKIPALSSTYFASLSAADLTGILETAITNGAVLARVGSTETITGIWTFSTNPTFNAGGITWASVSKTGSSLADLATRSASDLSSGTLPSARLSGTYSSALTFNHPSNIFLGDHRSTDGSVGVTGTCNFTAGTVTVKNGLIMTCP